MILKCKFCGSYDVTDKYSYMRKVHVMGCNDCKEVWIRTGKNEKDIEDIQQRTINVGGKYRHFKGSLYRITGLALHTETDETMVIYHQMRSDNETTYARPMEMFLGITEDGVLRFVEEN